MALADRYRAANLSCTDKVCRQIHQFAGIAPDLFFETSNASQQKTCKGDVESVLFKTALFAKKASAAGTVEDEK